MFGFDYIDKIYNTLIEKEADLVTSLDLPHGIFTYGIRTKAFGKIIEMKQTDSTEVWGDYFYKNPDIFKVEKLEVSDNEKRENYRLTMDYPEDFNFFEAVYSHFGEDAYKVSSKELISFLDKNPEIVSINKDLKQMYTKRWEAQRDSKYNK